MADIDQIDRRIIALLRDDARRSFQDIGRRVGLSAPAIKRRVDRLEAAGVIRGYTVQQQVRVVGQAVAPKALQYRQGMTVLDVIIEVGGLSEFASGNRARIIREVDGKRTEIRVRVDDLLNKGRTDRNVPMLPGDVLVIPESIL
jgi:DNA-binding Lrp family transcriptional regulator